MIYDTASELVALYKYGTIDSKYQTADYRIVLIQVTQQFACSVSFFYDPREIQQISYFEDLGSEHSYIKVRGDEPGSYLFWAFVVRASKMSLVEARESLIPQIKDIVMKDPDSHCPDIGEW